MSPDDDVVTGYRLDAVEREIRRLTDEAVSQKWLDERFARLSDHIKDVAKDVAEIKATEKSRRTAVYAAVVTGVISVVSALVVVAMTVPGGPL